MSLQRFREAVQAARALPLVDDTLADVDGPQLTTGQPTEAMLEETTAKLITVEHELARVPDALVAADLAASELNLHFSFDLGDDATAQWMAASAYLDSVRGALLRRMQVLQSMATTYAAARAKVEHDLGWQAYVRDQFGVDPASIEREMKLCVLEPDACC